MGGTGASAEIGILRLAPLTRFPELVHGVSTRHRPGGGDWNLSVRRGTPQYPASWDSATLNRWMLARELGVPLERMVGCQQVHGSRVAVVGEEDAGRGMSPERPALPDTDGLVTATPELYLLALSADCPPVMLYDPVRRAVGIAHSGWKGTVGRIAGEVVRTMEKELGTRPGDLIAAVGPGVGPCCYDVSEHVVQAAVGAFGRTAWDGDGSEQPLLERRDGHTYFNIPAAIRAALVTEGVPREQIGMADVCTADNTHVFYSHRGERGLCGLFGAVIGLRA